MYPSHLYLVRHGQTAWNAQRRLQGRIDISLNEAGTAEAERLREELAGKTFAAVYSSPLQRAYETARILNRPHGHEIQVHSDLQEASYGALEGLTIEEYHYRRERVLAERPLLTPQENLHFKLDPDAESDNEVYQRAEKVFKELFEKYAGSSVLVVTHGAFMRTVITRILEREPRSVRVPNASCAVLTKRGPQIAVTSLMGIELL